MKIKINFKQLLEDITYTNRMTKMYDVGEIISRNQYYQLKDGLVKWLLTHNFTKYTIDSIEYFVDNVGAKSPLVKLTVRYGDTTCLLHQPLNKQMYKILNIEKDVPFETEYVPVNYNKDYEPFNEEKFRECIARMMSIRIRFLRETLDDHGFWQAYMVNKNSNHPWMKDFRIFLPMKGACSIEITEEKVQQ